MGKLFKTVLTFIGFKFLTLEEKVKEKEQKILQHADDYYKEVVAFADEDYIKAEDEKRKMLQDLKMEADKLSTAKIDIIKTLTKYEDNIKKEGNEIVTNLCSVLKNTLEADIKKIKEKL